MPHVFRKPNPSPIINGPHNRHDEFFPLSSSRFANLPLVFLQPVFLLQRFPHMYNFSHVIQIFALVGEVSSCFVKELVTVIPAPTANHFIISFFLFVHHKILVVIRKRVHVAFKHEVSWGDLGCSHLRGPSSPIMIFPRSCISRFGKVIDMGPKSIVLEHSFVVA